MYWLPPACTELLSTGLAAKIEVSFGETPLEVLLADRGREEFGDLPLLLFGLLFVVRFA